MRVPKCVNFGVVDAYGSASGQKPDGSANCRHAGHANHVDNRHFDDPEYLLPSGLLADLLPPASNKPDYTHFWTRITRSSKNFCSGKSIPIYTYESRVIKIPLCSYTGCHFRTLVRRVQKPCILLLP